MNCFQSLITMQTPRKSPTLLLVRIHGDAYAYSGDTDAFTRVPRMPVDLPEQLESALLQLRAIDQGKSVVPESRGSGEDVSRDVEIWGGGGGGRPIFAWPS